jgi:hypothetical protein
MRLERVERFHAFDVLVLDLLAIDVSFPTQLLKGVRV